MGNSAANRRDVALPETPSVRRPPSLLVGPGRLAEYGPDDLELIHRPRLNQGDRHSRSAPTASASHPGATAALPPHKLPIRHPVRLVGIRPLPLLQIFYISLKIPLELRTRNRGYDGIRVLLIGEMARRRVVHPCHDPAVVTRPLVTGRGADPSGRGAGAAGPLTYPHSASPACPKSRGTRHAVRECGLGFRGAPCCRRTSRTASQSYRQSASRPGPTYRAGGRAPD